MIITHSNEASIDEFLSVCLVAYAMGDTHVKRIKYADVQNTIDNMSSNDVAIGIGGVVDFYRRIFDPQQSTVTAEIANFYNIKLPKGYLWDYFSDLTTKGAVDARKLYDIPLEQIELIHKAVSIILKVWDLILPEGDNTKTLLFITIRCYLGQCDFKLDLDTLMGIQTIVAVAYPKQYAEAVKQIDT